MGFFSFKFRDNGRGIIESYIKARRIKESARMRRAMPGPIRKRERKGEGEREREREKKKGKKVTKVVSIATFAAARMTDRKSYVCAGDFPRKNRWRAIPVAADDLNSLDGTFFILNRIVRSGARARARVIYILHFHCKSAIHLYNASAGWSHGDARAD